MEVRVSYEPKRGCGFRKGGGIYLVSDSPGEPCSALPIPLEVCPVCHAGVHATRGWTWINPKAMLGLPRGPHPPEEHNERCPFSQLDGLGLGERCGLLWVGGSFYPTPQDFTREAHEMGVSRRIRSVPKDFELGCWVLLAHRQGIPGATKEDHAVAPPHAGPLPEARPAVFHAFRPSAVEYVVKGDETEEELAALEKRGLSLVKVIPIGEQIETGVQP